MFHHGKKGTAALTHEHASGLNMREILVTLLRSRVLKQPPSCAVAPIANGTEASPEIAPEGTHVDSIEQSQRVNGSLDVI